MVPLKFAMLLLMHILTNHAANTSSHCANDDADICSFLPSRDIQKSASYTTAHRRRKEKGNRKERRRKGSLQMMTRALEPPVIRWAKVQT